MPQSRDFSIIVFAPRSAATATCGSVPPVPFADSLAAPQRDYAADHYAQPTRTKYDAIGAFTVATQRRRFLHTYCVTAQRGKR
ncbi:hypothetical protein FJT64_018515 [Amphibalanus amphitrite]|uniref:Uncharacterized protein n=1 Tax=Amphibalanus amphitrite TaxID=1232801 RepID=A0A6A4X6B2_AMPAM|nr:hypothetical protein FJT64_018515 [Amphibalanus amphitrite]